MSIEIEEMVDDSFAQFGLRGEILKAVVELGYESPSPIQLKTIPLLLEGKDIIGQAQTGTGKTAAFALPALEAIDVKKKDVQVLVLTPTRELAIQVAEAFHSYAKNLGRLKVLPIYGGQSISLQIRHLRDGAQVVVGTPGRVMDHIRRETLDFSNLKMVVLDEADEMLKMGFQEDVEFILSHTPEERQTALFSATMPKSVQRIAEKYLQDAENIEVERKTMTVPTIKQFYVNVSESQKADVLTRFLEMESAAGEAVIIFHRTKIGAANLTEKLQARGYAAEAMHGDMNQNQREAVIKKLKSGKIEIVVATDVAARGLDVEQITTVINFDMPSDTDSYVHRIGRTGRAGREGKAILFVTPRQKRMMNDIERYTKQKIEPLKLPSSADIAKRRVALLKEKILNTLLEQNLELYLALVEDLADESGCDIAEIAAAATLLAVGDKVLEVEVEPETQKFAFAEEGMVRLFVDIGRQQGINPGNIVGAIVNEADVPSKAIGAIDVYDRYTLVDVPSEFVKKVLSGMKHARILKQSVNIRPATTEEIEAPKFERGRRRGERKFKSFEDERRPKFFDNFDRKPKRRKEPKVGKTKRKSDVKTFPKRKKKSK